ncbi:MAG: ATP synthase alpha chain, partial [uncultured Frankineae bacterium]
DGAQHPPGGRPVRDRAVRHVVQRRDHPRGGRHRRRGRRRHRPCRGPVLHDGQRAAGVRGRRARSRPEPRHARGRRRHPRRPRRHRGGPGGASHRRHPVGARRGRLPRPRRRPARPADRRQGRDRGGGAAHPRAAGAHRGAAPAGHRAVADRHQGRRRHDGDRPRPAPAHHRRPADGQERGRAGRDHQPARELGDRRPQEAGQVHLRRHRPEGVDDRRDRRSPHGRRGDGVHHRRRRAGLAARRLQVPRALHRLVHRPALDVQRPARPDRVRR